MQSIHVTCAIIERSNLILAAQRSRTMKMPLKWEFPGGKIDSGETAEESLRRELMEELRIAVTIQDRLKPVCHTYSDVAIILHPFVCRLAAGEPARIEHAALIWLPLEQLDALDWAAADVPVLEAYRRWKAADKQI